MKRRTTSASSERAAAVSRPSRVGTLVMLVVVLASMLVVALMGRDLWRRLPGVQYRRIDWQAVMQARSEYTGPALEAMVLVANSQGITQAACGRRPAREVAAEIRERLGYLRSTQLGRLQLAAAVMLDLERAGRPVSEWWPAVRSYVEGLDRASLAHHLNELILADGKVLRRMGLSEGVAVGAALAGAGEPHGPFLETFVAQIERLLAEGEVAGAADVLTLPEPLHQREGGSERTAEGGSERAGEVGLERAANDGSNRGAGLDSRAAEVCRRTLRRLLREWIIETGPPGIRLLASDLLAEEIGRSAPAAGSTEAEIAAKCREWRQSYRMRAAECVPLPGLLRISDDPPSGQMSGQLEASLWSVTWFGAAALGTGILAGVACLAGRRSREISRPRGSWLLGLVPAALLVLAALGVNSIWPGLWEGDFARWDRDGWSLPRYPVVAAVAGIVTLLGISALIGRGPGRWRPGAWLGATARPAAAATVVLTAVTAWMFGGAWAELHGCDFWYAAGVDHPVRLLSGPSMRELLAALRSWEP